MKIVFHISLLEKDTTKKRQIDENNTAKLNIGDNKSDEYKIKAIQDSVVYTRELAGNLPGLYYLVFQKSYLKEKNI